MSQFTIESLPEELLIEVFKLIDQKTLKNVALTCKQWRDIAEQSVSWSLLLNYNNEVGEDEEWKETMLTSNRKYANVTIDGLVDLSLSLDIFENLAPNITTLKLYEIVLEDLQLLLKFFNMMTSVKQMILIKVLSGISEQDIEALEPSELPSFPNLRKLEIIQSEYKMLEFFKSAQLTSLKVMNDPISDRFQPSSGPLQKLLSSQKSLEKLALRSFTHETSKLFETAIDEEIIPFKLRELSLMNMKLKESPNEYNNLLKFMKPHCKTIDSLEMTHKFPEFVYEFVFAKFKNLKSLRLNAETMPTDPLFFERLEDNLSVKTLTLLGESDSSISQLFKHLPNVDHVELDEDCYYETLKSIADNLKKLKSLKVKSFNGSLFRQINFPSLKALSIGCVEDIEWDLFTKEAPGITHLHIDEFDDFLEDLNIKKILESFRMESLTINGIIHGDKEFFDVIRKYGSSLKSLKLDERSLVSDIPQEPNKVADIRSLCFGQLPISDPLSTGRGAWNEELYDDKLPEDQYNAWGEADEVDPFDLELMLEELGLDDDEFDEDDDFDHEYDGYDLEPDLDDLDDFYP